MVEGWPNIALEQVANLSGGYAFKSSEYAPSGRFVLRTLNIGDDGRVDRDQAVYIPLDACTQYKRFELQANDILFVMVGATLGKVGLVTKRDLPALLNQNMWRVRAVGGKIDERFLYYAFKFSASSGLASASGAARLFVRRDDYRRLAIPFPPIEHQTHIASVLGSLDEKIDLNRRMNETLEAMARAIYKDWFVDFGPTCAKMAGRPSYLAPEIGRLFPDRLDDEGKPQGWEFVPARNIIDFNPSERLEQGDSAPYLDMAALPTTGSCPDAVVDRPFSSGSKFRNGDALLARITPCLENGKAAFVQMLPDRAVGWGSTEFIVMRAQPPMPAAYAYLIARDPAFKDRAVRSMTGTSGRQRVQVNALTEFVVTRPSPDVARAFDMIVTPYFSKIAANARQSETLAEIRNLLLPKLMSGEIRVKDAEKVVEAVA